MRALSSAELRFRGVALALDELDLGFDRVGVRHLAAAFLLARDVEELFGLVLALLGIGELAHGRDHGVVVLRHGGDQAARGDFRFGARHGFGHLRLAVVGALDEIENVAVHDGLVVVDVRAVVGDERAGRRAVGLGVDELVERADAWAAGRPWPARYPRGRAARRCWRRGSAGCWRERAPWRRRESGAGERWGKRGAGFAPTRPGTRPDPAPQSTECAALEDPV